jgi:hypothetical protein
MLLTRCFIFSYNKHMTVGRGCPAFVSTNSELQLTAM